MNSEYDVLKLKNQLCFPLYLCAKEVTHRYGDILAELDLTYTQYVVMMYLWEVGEGSVKAMGEALMLDPSTLTPLLKKLESKGYITRTRSETDERSLMIRLTEEGAQLKDKAVIVPQKMKQCIGLTDSEGEDLCRLLMKVLANIEKE
ncbi:MAG: MarR family transcriptional regulator [Ruminococcus sp.]|nr:MarR family transcriptional regulator [Ruminococcus sp.]